MQDFWKCLAHKVRSRRLRRLFQKTFLQHLPNEILVKISHDVHGKDLLSFGLTCTRLYDIVKDQLKDCRAFLLEVSRPLADRYEFYRRLAQIRCFHRMTNYVTALNLTGGPPFGNANFALDLENTHLNPSEEREHSEVIKRMFMVTPPLTNTTVVRLCKSKLIGNYGMAIVLSLWCPFIRSLRLTGDVGWLDFENCLEEYSYHYVRGFGPRNVLPFCELSSIAIRQVSVQGFLIITTLPSIASIEAHFVHGPLQGQLPTDAMPWLKAINPRIKKLCLSVRSGTGLAGMTLIVSKMRRLQSFRVRNR